MSFWYDIFEGFLEELIEFYLKKPRFFLKNRDFDKNEKMFAKMLTISVKNDIIFVLRTPLSEIYQSNRILQWFLVIITN